MTYLICRLCSHARGSCCARRRASDPLFLVSSGGQPRRCRARGSLFAQRASDSRLAFSSMEATWLLLALTPLPSIASSTRPHTQVSLLAHAASDAPRSSPEDSWRHLNWRPQPIAIGWCGVLLAFASSPQSWLSYTRRVSICRFTASSIGSYLRLRRIAVGLRAALDSDAPAHRLQLAHSGGLFVALSLPSAPPIRWSATSSRKFIMDGSTIERNPRQTMTTHIRVARAVHGDAPLFPIVAGGLRALDKWLPPAPKTQLRYKWSLQYIRLPSAAEALNQPSHFTLHTASACPVTHGKCATAHTPPSRAGIPGGSARPELHNTTDTAIRALTRQLPPIPSLMHRVHARPGSAYGRLDGGDGGFASAQGGKIYMQRAWRTSRAHKHVSLRFLHARDAEGPTPRPLTAARRAAATAHGLNSAVHARRSRTPGVLKRLHEWSSTPWRRYAWPYHVRLPWKEWSPANRQQPTPSQWSRS